MADREKPRTDTAANSTPLVARGLSRRFRKGDHEVRALESVTFSFEAGRLYVVQGPSGSGKSTLLLVLGGMLTPTTGTVAWQDQDLYVLGPAGRNRFRKQTVGFVFQKFHLLPYLSVRDNIRLSVALRGMAGSADEHIRQAADRLGIADRLDHRPSELSVGEQQRVATARTLVTQPDLILADEPTGNLDAANQKIIGECLLQECRRGAVVIVATHHEDLMRLGHCSIRLEKGRVVPETAGAD